MTIIWSLILIYVNSRALEKPMKIRCLPIIKSDFKTVIKKLLGNKRDEHLNFNKNIANICKSASRRLNALSILMSVFYF